MLTENERKQLEQIRERFEWLPPCEEYNLLLTSDQQALVDQERFQWKCISLSWSARITGQEDPLEQMYRSKQLSRWGKTYFQLRTDYYWNFWLITQAVWGHIEINPSSGINTPGEFFVLALKRTSMHQIFKSAESYREMSSSKRQKTVKLLSKKLSGELPQKGQQLNTLLKENQLRNSLAEKWCSEMMQFILSLAVKHAKNNSRLRLLLEDLDRSIVRICGHELNAPKADTKLQTAARSIAWKNGRKIYASRGGVYRENA